MNEYDSLQTTTDPSGAHAKTPTEQPEVLQSWKRCRLQKLDPDARYPLPVIAKKALEKRLAAQGRLIKRLSSYVQILSPAILLPGNILSYADASATILYCFYDDSATFPDTMQNYAPGVQRSEFAAGTNSIALALIHQKPFQVTGSEHFFVSFQHEASATAPVWNVDGSICGALTLSGKQSAIHENALDIITCLADYLCKISELEEINEDLSESNQALSAMLDIVRDGVAYTKNGRIVRLNRALCQITGNTSYQMIGQRIAHVLKTHPDLTGIMERRNGKNSESELILETPKVSVKCLFRMIGLDDPNRATAGKILLFSPRGQPAQPNLGHTAKYHFSDIMGQSSALKKTLDLARKAATHDARVIIEGESGTGKEMIGQAIHNSSQRRDGPFIAIDCGTVPKELLESHLFGYEGGSFTGAKREGHAGFFEVAGEGTILLDEIGNMSTEMQVKMLRVLQEGYFTRVGGTNQIHSNPRIIAATNSSLSDLVDKGLFREDLYYRLNVVNIKIPPLRERREDIPVLIAWMLQTLPSGSRPVKLDNKALDLLYHYDWPGNVRQLQNTIERALIVATDGIITPRDLPAEIYQSPPPRNTALPSEIMPLQQAIGEYVKHVMELNGRNISKVAKALDVSRSTVYKYFRHTDG